MRYPSCCQVSHQLHNTRSHTRAATYRTTRILDTPANIPHRNQPTDQVQHAHIELPAREAQRSDASNRLLHPHAVVERSRDNQEKEKDQDLEDQAAQDNIFTAVVVILRIRVRQHATTSSLDQEAEYITADEDLGHPGHADEREVLALAGAHQAGKRHVDGGGEEDRGEQDEEGLDNVGSQAVHVIVSNGACGVANGFDCRLCVSLDVFP